MDISYTKIVVTIFPGKEGSVTSERQDTVLFDVLYMNPNWKVNVQLQFKIDIVPSPILYSNEEIIRFRGHGYGADEMIPDFEVDTGRRFNLPKLTAFPSNVDMPYQFQLFEAGITNQPEGVCEQWKGSLPTCSLSDTEISHGFVFEKRYKARGLRWNQ